MSALALVPAPNVLDRLRDALAVRCQAIERERPEVLDLTMEVLGALHDHLSGRASSLAGNRAPKYFRECLRGEHALTLEDLARLAMDAPTALGPALDRLLRPTGYRVVVNDVPGPSSAPEAAAQLVEEINIVTVALLRALSDGRQSDRGEGALLVRQLDGIERRVAALRQAIGGTR